MRRIAMTLGLACGFLLLLMLALQTHAAPAAPAGRHCGGVGPLPPGDPYYCGCTWGEVLFHGRPVPGAAVTLTYESDAVAGTTRSTSLEPAPYFDLTGHILGARRGDMLTLTAHFAGQTVVRPFRAWPGTDEEQHIALALPEQGVWSPWVTGGTTRALALAGDVVWAGGPAGVISVELTSGVSLTHTLPWAEPLVRALAVGTDGHAWAAGDGGVAEFDGSGWQVHTHPLIGTPRALAVDPASGAIWLGGGDATGSVAAYTGTWQVAGSFAAPVTALTVDEEERVWAGTWGDGVYRQDGSGGWTRYRDTDGLASDWVLATAAGGGAVWFGTYPYLSGEGPRGGIARYELAMGTWRTYTTAHGLPADTSFPQAPASIYTLALGEDGWPWAGTVDGVRFLPEGEHWFPYTTTHGLRGGPVLALAAGNGTVIAAVPAGLDRLDLGAVPGSPPTAQIVEVAPLTLTLGTTLTLSGESGDGDEGGAQIVGWDWSSSLDGPLCTSASCTLPYDLFTPGVHSITLRVQDDEGVWSAPVTEAVEVKGTQRVYLPLVLR
jgi:hypothetical protein